VRLKQSEKAVEELRRAAELDPDSAQYAYVYAVALHSVGRPGEAIAALKGALTKHPGNRDILVALMTFSRDAGQLVSALAYAEELAKTNPGDRGLADLIQTMKRELAGSNNRDDPQ
jgi:predicted Zn-dependent protease